MLNNKCLKSNVASTSAQNEVVRRRHHVVKAFERYADINFILMQASRGDGDDIASDDVSPAIIWPLTLCFGAAVEAMVLSLMP